MVEQLLKYVPTIAERDLLKSHAHEMESFARPDRFLLEMSRYSGTSLIRTSLIKQDATINRTILVSFMTLPPPSPPSLPRIPRYSQRLKSLFFKKTLSDHLDDVRPKVEAIHYTCKELKTSKKLRTVRTTTRIFALNQESVNSGQCFFKFISNTRPVWFIS